MIQAVIYSMDRAMQLDSLLRSLQDLAMGLDGIAVIYRATSDLHRSAYDLLRRENGDSPEFIPVVFHEEKDKGVSGILSDILSKTEFVCLNVDDQVYFKKTLFQISREALYDNAFVWSWRLGPLQDPSWVRQTTSFGDSFTASWAYYVCEDPNRAEPSHSYLWHTDGAVYRSSDYRRVLDLACPGWEQMKLIPNDLELMGARAESLWPLRRHAVPPEPTCMTWQINKETTTVRKYKAPWVTIPETEVDAMAEAFLRGCRVRNDLLYASLQNPIPEWTTRFQQPNSLPTHVRACEEASAFYASLIQPRRP